MKSSGRCRILVSEELEEAVVFDEHPNARYAVVCDPIDGSSNLDAGVSVGTIFGVFKLPDSLVGPGKTVSAKDILRPGTEMIAAGFTMYGASAQLVITLKDGSVNGFTMENSLGEFILTHPDMKMPSKKGIYSVNEGNSMYWEPWVNEYFHSLKFPGEGKKPYSARYIGSMVADAYRTLLYGGLFAYPRIPRAPRASCVSYTNVLPWPCCSKTLAVWPSTRTPSVSLKSCPRRSTTAAVSTWARRMKSKRSSTCTRSTTNKIIATC